MIQAYDLIEGDGACPKCGGAGEYLNVHKSNWVVCRRHKTAWNIGWNLHSSWRHENEAIWEENALFISQCCIVEPLWRKSDVARLKLRVIDGERTA